MGLKTAGFNSKEMSTNQVIDSSKETTSISGPIYTYKSSKSPYNRNIDKEENRQ